MVVLLLLLCQLACFQQAKSGQPPKPLLSWRTAASQDAPKIPLWSLNKVAREAQWQAWHHKSSFSCTRRCRASLQQALTRLLPSLRLLSMSWTLMGAGHRVAAPWRRAVMLRLQIPQHLKLRCVRTIPRAHHLFTASVNCLPFATSKQNHLDFEPSSLGNHIACYQTSLLAAHRQWGGQVACNRIPCSMLQGFVQIHKIPSIDTM